jgi:hypothetical protein
MCYEKFECRLGKAIRQQWDWLLSRGVIKDGTESDQEEYVLALMVAEHFRWNGIAILETFALALEDANYHRECNQVRGMISNLKRKQKK